VMLASLSAWRLARVHRDAPYSQVSVLRQKVVAHVTGITPGTAESGYAVDSELTNRPYGPREESERNDHYP